MKNKNFASQLVEKRPILVLIGFLFLGVLALSLSRGTLFRGFLSLEQTDEFEKQMEGINANESYIMERIEDDPVEHEGIELHVTPVQADHDKDVQSETSWMATKPVVFKALNDAGTLRGLLAYSEAYLDGNTLNITDYSQSANTEIVKVQFDLNGNESFDDAADLTLTKESDPIYMAKVNRPTRAALVDVEIDESLLGGGEYAYGMRVEDADGRHDETHITIDIPEEVELSSTIECGFGARPPSENDALVSALWTVTGHQIDAGDGAADVDPANWEYEWTFSPEESSLALEDDGATAAVTHDKPLADGAISIDATVTATYSIDPSLVVSDTCTYELEPEPAGEVAAAFGFDYSYLPFGGAETGVEFTFNNETIFENTEIADFDWDFGDGVLGNTGSDVSIDAAHVYDYPTGDDRNNLDAYRNDYSVTLSVTDTDGGNHVVEEVIQVQKPIMADATCTVEWVTDRAEIVDLISFVPGVDRVVLASRNLLAVSMIETVLPPVIKLTVTDETSIVDATKAPALNSAATLVAYQDVPVGVAVFTQEVLESADRTVVGAITIAQIEEALGQNGVPIPATIADWNHLMLTLDYTHVAENAESLRDTVELGCNSVGLLSDDGGAEADLDIDFGSVIDADPLGGMQYDFGDFGIQFPGLFTNPFRVKQSMARLTPDMLDVLDPEVALNPDALADALEAAAADDVAAAEWENATIQKAYLSEFGNYHMINAVEGMSIYFEPQPFCEDIEVAVSVHPFDSLASYIGEVEVGGDTSWEDVLSTAIGSELNAVSVQAAHIIGVLNDYSSVNIDFGELEDLVLAELMAVASENAMPAEKPASHPADPAAYFTLNVNSDAAVCAPSFEPEVLCDVVDGDEEGEYIATLFVKGVEGQMALGDGSERVYYDFADNSEQVGSSGDILGAEGIQSIIDTGVIASYIYNQESDPQLHDEEGLGSTFTATVIYQELTQNEAGDWVEPDDGGELYSPECIIPDLDPEESIDAVEDEYSIVQGDATELDILKNDSHNDAAADPSNISMEIAADPLHGTVEILRDADENPYAILYTPDAEYVGEDDFKYVIKDLVDSDPQDSAVVTIQIEAVEASLSLDCIEADPFDGEGHATLNITEGFGEYAPLYSWSIDYEEEEPLSAVLAGWIVDEESGEVTSSDDFTFDIGGLISEYGSYEMTMDAYMVDPSIEEFDVAELTAVASASATCTWEEDVEPEPEPEDLPEEELDAECSIINIVEGDDNVVDQSLNYVDCSEYTYIDESVTIINNYYYGDEDDDEDEDQDDEDGDEEDEDDDDDEDDEEPEDVDAIVEAEAGKLGCYDLGSYVPYKDVPSTDLYEPIRFFSKVTVDTLVGSQHVVHGYPGNVFRPNGNTTRAEGVKMLMLAMCANDLATEKYGAIDDLLNDDPFEDVPKNNWFADKAAVAHKMGLIKGFTIDQETGEEVRGPIPYRPQQLITRAEFVKILTELYLAWNPELQFDPEDYYYAEDGEGFNDVTGYEWADPYFNFMREQEIFRGTESGNARGGDPITRLEAMIILYNTVAKLTENDSELTELYFGLSRE